jgi:hypothetical protein
LITFDPQYEADNAGDDEGAGDEDEDEDEDAEAAEPKQDGEDEEQEQAYYVRSRPFAIQVLKPNGDGLILACIAGDDGRLYVQSITAGKLQSSDDPSITPSKFSDSGETEELKFHEISSKLQDRLYDWLEEDLQIDDGYRSAIVFVVSLLAGANDVRFVFGDKIGAIYSGVRRGSESSVRHRSTAFN